MKLSTLSILLGLGLSVPNAYGLLNPASFGQAVRKFPRSLPWGYVLMTIGTLWFLWNLKNENVADFAQYKQAMYFGFGLTGLAVCIFVQDFLAVRGLAIVLMLLAKLMVDTARWVDTEWRLVIVIWAYAWVVAGIWFTAWPWRLRDLVNWVTATEKRIRIGSAIRLAFGVFVLILGLTAF